MTKKWVDAMMELQKEKDTAVAHDKADKLLCSLLRWLNYGKVVDEYEKILKWYE